jgi:hypothetical protein
MAWHKNRNMLSTGKAVKGFMSAPNKVLFLRGTHAVERAHFLAQPISVPLVFGKHLMCFAGKTAV